VQRQRGNPWIATERSDIDVVIQPHHTSLLLAKIAEAVAQQVKNTTVFNAKLA
jgi:acetyl-CoA carboxylase carboxyltransferase component